MSRSVRCRLARLSAAEQIAVAVTILTQLASTWEWLDGQRQTEGSPIQAR